MPGVAAFSTAIRPLLPSNGHQGGSATTASRIRWSQGPARPLGAARPREAAQPREVGKELHVYEEPHGCNELCVRKVPRVREELPRSQQSRNTHLLATTTLLRLTLPRLPSLPCCRSCTCRAVDAFVAAAAPPRSSVTTASTATKKAVALGTVALVPRPALEGDHSKCGDNKLGP